MISSKAKASQLLEEYYHQWENNPARNASGYDYERTFVEMMQKVQQEIFQQSVGDIPKNKNRKKN